MLSRAHDDKIFFYFSDDPAQSQDLYENEEHNCLHLKGQMLYMKDWDQIIFLGMPL
jgi:hypothetical protein